MNTYGVNIKYTAYYHPQANPCERINKVIKTMLASYVSENHRSWDKHLAKVGSAIRTSRHEVTSFSPNFIVFGRETSGYQQKPDSDDGAIQFDRTGINDDRSRGLARVYADIKSKLRKAYDHSKQNYDLRRRDTQYLPNQLVWRRNYVLSDASKFFTAKLAPKYLGPFTVAKRLSPWTYELRDENNKYRGVWHIKDLKAHPPDD